MAGGKGQTERREVVQPNLFFVPEVVVVRKVVAVVEEVSPDLRNRGENGKISHYRHHETGVSGKRVKATVPVKRIYEVMPTGGVKED